LAQAGAHPFVHIPYNSIASLFQQMQSAASGSSTSSSFSASLTGQNLPTLSLGAAATSSLAPSPLSSTPSSQFTSAILSALVAVQQTPLSAQGVAGQVSAVNSNGDGAWSLSQVEQPLTGGSATTSPQQASIANAFAQLDTNGGGSLSQGELATALQSLQQQADPTQPTSGRHHHHHHMQAQAGSSTTDPGTLTSTLSDSATGQATSNVTTAFTTPPTISAAA
jgi:hypothetical protein